MAKAEHGHAYRAAPLAAVGTLALFAVWISLGVGGSTVVRYIDDLATAAAALAATLACIRAATISGGQLRRFWLLLAAATAAWSLGELLWAVYDLVLNTTAVPVPSWADLGYLCAIPLAAAALLVHPALRGRPIGKVRAVLDALTLASALFLLFWTLLLGPLWRTTDLTSLGGLVALAYPLGDVVVVFLVVLVIRVASNRRQPDYWLLLTGLLAITCSDALYGYLTEVKQYSTGNLIDSGWVFGYLAIALAAGSARTRSAVDAPAGEPSLSPAAIVVPLLTLLTALGFVAIRMQLGHRLDHTGLTTAFVLVILVLLRQTLVATDLARTRGTQAGLGERLLRTVGSTAPNTGRRT